MSKEDIKEQISNLEKNKKRDIERFDYINNELNKIEEDILLSKKRDEHFLSSVRSLDPEIEEIYEERRKMYFDYLDKGDEAKAYYQSKQREIVEQYDNEIRELNKKLEDNKEKDKN